MPLHPADTIVNVGLESARVLKAVANLLRLGPVKEFSRDRANNSGALLNNRNWVSPVILAKSVQNNATVASSENKPAAMEKMNAHAMLIRMFATGQHLHRRAVQTSSSRSSASIVNADNNQ